VGRDWTPRRYVAGAGSDNRHGAARRLAAIDSSSRCQPSVLDVAAAAAAAVAVWRTEMSRRACPALLAGQRVSNT